MGNVIQRPGEDADLVTLPVNLHPDAVDLPLNGRRAYPSHGGGDGWRRTRQHRLDRPADPERYLAQPGGCPVRIQGSGRGVGEGTGELICPPHVCDRCSGGTGDGVGHHAIEGTLAQVAREQADEELPFGGRCAAHQGCQQPTALSLRANAGLRADLAERLISLGQREHRVRDIWRLHRAVLAEQVGQCGVADAYLALRQVARQEGDRYRDLRGRHLAQQAGYLLDLGEAAGVGGDRRGGLHYRIQQHVATASLSAAPPLPISFSAPTCPHHGATGPIGTTTLSRKPCGGMLVGGDLAPRAKPGRQPRTGQSQARGAPRPRRRRRADLGSYSLARIVRLRRHVQPVLPWP